MWGVALSNSVWVTKNELKSGPHEQNRRGVAATAGSKATHLPEYCEQNQSIGMKNEVRQVSRLQAWAGSLSQGWGMDLELMDASCSTQRHVPEVLSRPLRAFAITLPGRWVGLQLIGKPNSIWVHIPNDPPTKSEADTRDGKWMEENESRSLIAGIRDAKKCEKLDPKWLLGRNDSGIKCAVMIVESTIANGSWVSVKAKARWRGKYRWRLDGDSQ